MFSVESNPEASDARQALAGAQARLTATRARLATGLKVADARDDGASWSMAQNLRAKAAAWRTADDSLARGQSLLDVAQAGAAEIVDLLADMRGKALALEDRSLDAPSRAAVLNDLKELARQVDRVAMTTEFFGRRPLADTLTQSTVTTVGSGYVIPSAPMTPTSLRGAIQPGVGGASQTFTRDGGPNAGRIDLYLQAYTVPDVLEIYQGSVRVAATGQAYAPGGGAVGPGQPVSGENVLSFDYDPTLGRLLEYRFNQGLNASGSLWSVEGAVLQALGAPLPTPTPITSTTTLTTSSAATYSFISDGAGNREDVQAWPLTVQALGLDAVDWNDPGSPFGAIDAALRTATSATVYFGQREAAFDRILAFNHVTEDVLARGIGELVDADLAQESARLKADEAREQLAAYGIAIAAQGPRMLLALFN